MDAASPRVTNAPLPGILDVIVFSSAAALCVVIVATMRIFDVFRPEGVAVRMPLTNAPARFELEGTDAVREHVATSATLLVPGVETGALVAFAASIAIAAAGALVVLGALIRIALAFRAGQIFTSTTTRALTLIGGTVFAAACGVLLTDALGRSGACAALGIPYEPIHMLDLVPYAPVWAVAIAVGLIAAAFERGQRMQRDTEGLV